MKIFSENEWSPLKEVIVGNTFDIFEMEVDLSFKLFFKDNLWGWLQGSPDKITIKKQYIDELNEDISGLVNTLIAENITVHRPKLPTTIEKYTIGGVEVTGMPPLNVRDQTIIIDDTLVETAPCQRSRYFENNTMSHIFNNIDGNWLRMPKSQMRDENFDMELIQIKRDLVHTVGSDYTKSDFFKNDDFIIDVPDQYDIMIDGANCVRFGKDIIINIANRNQYLGYLWFKEHFPNKNWHPIYSLCDNHLDSFIIPLCEGVLLLRNKLFLEQIPDFLKEWKIIYPPNTTPQFPAYNENDALLTSTYIDMNVLSLDDKKIICNTLYPELSELLYKEGFDPIPVQHRHRRIFGGGFHCFTLDLLREE